MLTVLNTHVRDVIQFSALSLVSPCSYQGQFHYISLHIKPSNTLKTESYSPSTIRENRTYSDWQSCGCSVRFRLAQFDPQVNQGVARTGDAGNLTGTWGQQQSGTYSHWCWQNWWFGVGQLHRMNTPAVVIRCVGGRNRPNRKILLTARDKCVNNLNEVAIKRGRGEEMCLDENTVTKVTIIFRITPVLVNA